MARSFLSAFLAGDSAAAALLPLDFRDPTARAQRVARARQQVVPASLLAELRAQNADLHAAGAGDEAGDAQSGAAARAANLAALAQPGTVAVITGQQVGLFLGPAYTIYKAATAVATARALTEETGVRCVPIFWLQTEDHDFAEIGVCHVLDGAGRPRTLTIAPDPALPPRTSIAHHRLGDDVDVALASLADALVGTPASDEVLALLRAHYRPGVPVSRAFAGALASLFAADGLLIFDPRNPVVARLAVPLYRRAIDEHVAISGALTTRKAALAQADLSEQVAARTACPLVFFHAAGPHGPRHRLDSGIDGHTTAGTDAGRVWGLAGVPGATVTDAELRRHMEEDPLRFSTSALLRPLLQDTLFPTAAYVAGPAEIAYFAQLGPLYDLFGLAQPLVVLRARLRCLDARTQRLLGQLGLAAADIDQPTDQLLQRLAAAAPTPAALPSPASLAADITEGVRPALDRLRAALAGVDVTLLRTADRRRAQIIGSLDRLLEKYTRALARTDATRLGQVQRLRAWLCPDGHPQERHYGWPSLAARSGRDRFARAVNAAIATSPFSPAIKEICP